MSEMNVVFQRTQLVTKIIFRYLNTTVKNAVVTVPAVSTSTYYLLESALHVNGKVRYQNKNI